MRLEVEKYYWRVLLTSLSCSELVLAGFECRVNGEETTWSLHLFFKHKLFALLLFGPQGLHEGIRVTDWLLRFADGEKSSARPNLDLRFRKVSFTPKLPR